MISTGYIDIDELLGGGFKKQAVTIIAGRPAMCKTAFALSMVKEICIRRKIPTAFFSLVLSKGQFAKRLGAVVKADVIGKSPIFIDDTKEITIEEIRSKLYELKKGYDVQIVFIDNLLLLFKSQLTEQKLNVKFKELDELAKELDVAVVAISLVKRDWYRGLPKPQSYGESPGLKELDGYASEEYANTIAFLHRPDYYLERFEKPKDNIETVKLIIAKANGEYKTKAIDLYFNRLTAFFVKSE